MPELDDVFRQLYDWIVGSSRSGAIFMGAIAGLVIMFGRRDIGWKRLQWIAEGLFVIIMIPAMVTFIWYIGHAVAASVNLR